MGPFLPAMEEKRRKKFESYFYITPGCWIWTRGGSPLGYGAFWSEGKVKRAHRVSYELYVGPIPEGLVIRHLCHNPACVNPEHLLPGTQQENVNDTKLARRIPRGSERIMSKLTERNILSIRDLLSLGHSRADVAKLFHVNPNTIDDVANGVTWTHVL